MSTRAPLDTFPPSVPLTTLARNSALARNRPNPDRARVTNVYTPVRDTLCQHGRYHPSNRFRQAHHPKSTTPTHDVRQRALLLADKMPWHPRYNFLRS